MYGSVFLFYFPLIYPRFAWLSQTMHRTSFLKFIEVLCIMCEQTDNYRQLVNESIKAFVGTTSLCVGTSVLPKLFLNVYMRHFGNFSFETLIIFLLNLQILALIISIL